MTNPEIIEATSRTIVCSEIDVRRVAAMLDLDPLMFAEGGALPIGWQFFLLAGETRRSSLRPDGFPGLGLPMLGYDFPRLMLGGREVQYRDTIPIGANVRRNSCLINFVRKETSSGPIAVATIRHHLLRDQAIEPAVVETHTYILLHEAPRKPSPANVAEPIRADFRKRVVLDEIALFQYSALGFNSHRIHMDRSYARDVEGYPDLVVNGGLTTLLLTELLRAEVGVVPTVIRARYLAPLFCGRAISLAAALDGGAWRLTAHGDRGAMAVDIVATVL